MEAERLEKEALRLAEEARVAAEVAAQVAAELEERRAAEDKENAPLLDELKAKLAEEERARDYETEVRSGQTALARAPAARGCGHAALRSDGRAASISAPSVRTSAPRAVGAVRCVPRAA